MTALEINGLSFSYRKSTPLLQNVNLRLESGQLYALLGPNGGGKTTLLRQILFPSRKTAGYIRLFGKSLEAYKPRERGMALGYVPQRLPLPDISVRRLVLMGRYPYAQGKRFASGESDRTLAEAVMERMRLLGLADRSLQQLSGGEAQRAYIAHALCKGAQLYILDEPMSALDPQHQTELLQALRELAEMGAAVIFTTHDPNHALALPEVRIGLLKDELAEVERTEEGMKKIEALYGGALRILPHRDGFAASFNV